MRFVIISASEVVSDGYEKLDVDRIELYRSLVQLRMIYVHGGFRQHLDIINKALYGKYFSEASYSEKRDFYSIWNMQTLNGFAACNDLVMDGVECDVITNFDAEEDILKDICGGLKKPIVGISTTYILSWSEIVRMVRKIRSWNCDAIIVLGGAFVQDLYKLYGIDKLRGHLESNNIDYTFFGDRSEKDLSLLFEYLSNNGNDISVIDNLIYLDDDEKASVTSEVSYPANVSTDKEVWKY